MNLKTIARAGRAATAGQGGAFTLVEVLFAIAILGVGIVGILSLFVSGVGAARWAGRRSGAAMQAQSLYSQILTYEDNAGLRVYPKKMQETFFEATGAWKKTPAMIWVQSLVPGPYDANSRDPVQVSEQSRFWWQCKVGNYMFNVDDPLKLDDDKEATNDTTKQNPWGLVSIAIAVYQDWREGKEPISVYTTLLTLDNR
jgi:type II secretory pathway pseudopilin PulG